MNEILLADYMDVMPMIPELNREVLAICDPPYGIGQDGRNNHTRSKLAISKNYQNNKRYDNSSPDKSYFDELFRISKNQIIWGANHYISKIPLDSSCWIVWDKLNGKNDFADCELAWTSFDSAVRKINFMWNGMLQGKSIKEGHIQQGNKKLNEKRIHPNQKPVVLYRWILQNYAKPGQLIFDSHSGSGSLACACHLEKFDFIACEKDIDYHRDSVKRLDELRSQGVLF